MMRRTACALLLAATATFAAAPLKVGPGDVPPPELGSTLGREDVRTTDYAGKVLVVTFWASWCPPCRRELPMLEGLQRAANGRVQVVAVNIEDYEKFRTVARTLKPLAITITHDDWKKSSDAYGVNGIPHLVLIGRDGRVLQVHRGYSDEAIDGILAEINAQLTAPAGGAAPKPAGSL
jgi:thiol-disulfide isomerase/thioredoxin